MCHTLYFLLPNAVNQAINIVFIGVGYKITGAISLYNKGQQALIEGEPEEKRSVMRIKQEIQFRQRSMRNMWIIICSICFCVTFQGLYSLILFIWSDDECIVQHSSHILQSFTEITARSITNVIWIIPIIWLFWPLEYNCKR